MSDLEWEDLLKLLPNALKDNYTTSLYVISIDGFWVTNCQRGLSIFNDIDEKDYDKVIIVNNKLMDFLLSVRGCEEDDVRTIKYLRFLINHEEFKEAGERKPKRERAKRRYKKSRRRFRK